MKKEALIYLRKALDNPKAEFRIGQWESIKQLIERNRVLVVERTGWGKSMVYFLASKLLRQQGTGPTIIISPLLSLMRNQIEAAERIGIIARTINSTNTDDWIQIQNELDQNIVDVLLISPERLANDNFKKNVLSVIAENIGLFVIDEAHCISDWGHDFRPDYRRIVRVLQAIPSNIPVLATTATANNRVVDDVKLQLGKNLIIQRGSLVRKSLKLQNINIPSPAARMAWLAQNIPSLPGSGIIYTLTVRDAEWLAEWLQINGIKAETYHSKISNGDDHNNIKEELEQKLLNNEVKVLVATVALGMGFDKPDLGFVIHFQRPASVVHYYQQVGRAGRAVDEAFGILLCGEEDDKIADYFIRKAFPPQKNIKAILDILDKSESGMSVPEIQKFLNLKQTQIDKTLKFLTIESPSPVIKMGHKWFLTPMADSYEINQEYIDSIIEIRRKEQLQMQEYMHHTGCLMTFLQNALDDNLSENCRQCKNCNPELLLNESFDDELANKAGLFLRRNYRPIYPRKQWPLKNIFTSYSFEKKKIPDECQAWEGRALSLWRDAGWGRLVADGKYKTKRFSDKLIGACVDMLADWDLQPKPKWITCIPSSSNFDIVSDFTQRLADKINLPFIPCIEQIMENRPQKYMENSYQQVKNLDGVYRVNDTCSNNECLLIDYMVDSRWTFTVISALLRKAGCAGVYPLALALNSPRMD
jgi:ATP-dependent DNA helicase RecQ